jgi:hypothetical protein
VSLTSRDRKIVIVLALAALVAGYWFLALAPKVKQAGAAGERVVSEQQRLASARSQLVTLQRARTDYASDYATVVRLGKAIPTSVDAPSLMIQLQRAADGTDIRFSAIEAGDRLSAGSAPRSLATAAAQETGQSGGQAQGSGGQAPAEGGQASDAPVEADPAGDVARAREDTPAAREAAREDATQSLDAGGLEAVPLEFTFDGSFFDLADFFHEMKRFVEVANDRIEVGGRLMTIDRMTLEAKPDEFPEIKALVTATAYVSPKVGGVTAGATPEGPAPAAGQAEQQTTTPTAPAPTASVTP